MKKSVSIVLFALLLMASLPASAADTTYELNKGDSVTHQGEAIPGGVNPLYFDVQGAGVVGGHETCSKDPDTYCETVLLALTNPVADTDPNVVETATRLVSVSLSTDAADYDLFIYTSDADGTRGTELGSSTSFPIGDTSESVSGSIRTTDAAPTAYALVEVVYFAPTTPMSLRISF